MSLNGGKSLELLRQLEANDNWKIEGVSVTEVAHQFELPISPRGRRKKTEQEPKTEITKFEIVYIEIMHLPSEAGQEIIDFINKNKVIISNMAKQEKEQFNIAMAHFIELALESSRKEEVNKFDFSARAFQWLSNGASRWVCKHQTTDGHVCLQRSEWFLCACVKRHNLLEKSENFISFPSAIEWAEKEMADLENQTEDIDLNLQIRTEEQRTADFARLQEKLKNGPFWIDPLDMEPKRVSYKILIQIDTKPTDFKTFESRCGDILHYDERFPSPVKLATAINLDFDNFNFLQPTGENSDWHLITSLTTFYQEASVAEQAQRAWDQSRIVQQFKEGKIRRARYGYEEVETGFAVYFGACEDPDHLWENPNARDIHMEQLALRETISFSLDINDFRDFLGISTQTMTDEQILRIMHSTRARSKCMKEEIKDGKQNMARSA